MIPAHQRLEGDRPLARDVDDGLVMNLELLAAQRRAQIELEHAPRLGAGVHAGLEESIGAAAVGLGAVEREVGVLQKLIRIVAVVGRERDADADADHELMAGDVVGLGDPFDQSAGQRGGRRGIAAAAELHHCEFVAAESRHRIVIGDAFGKPAGDFLEQGVADGVAERIVDFLEVIEIEAKHRELIAALGEMQRALQPFPEQCPVRQIGQRVVPRHVVNLLLRLLPFGDVLEGRNPAAARHRLMHDTDRPLGAHDDALDRAPGAHVPDQFPDILRSGRPATGRPISAAREVSTMD